MGLRVLTIGRDNDEELTAIVLLLEGPQTALVDDLHRIDVWALIERGPRSQVVHNLDVEDVLIRLLSAQMDMAFWGECVEGLDVEDDSAEAETGHFACLCGHYCILGNVYFVPDEEFDLVILHKTSTHAKREGKLTTPFNLVKETHAREPEDHWVAAHCIAVL